MPSSIIFFANDVLASDTVKLGQLVPDVDIPTEGYYPLAVQEKDVQVTDPQVYEIIEAGLAKGVELDIEFIKKHFPAASKTHKLKTPEVFCQNIFQNEPDEDFAEWLDEVSELPLYMVTALHTILPRAELEDENKKQINTITGATLLSAGLPFGLGYAIGGPMMMQGMHRKKTNFPASEDQIVAVEYRQVEFKRSSETGAEPDSVDGNVREARLKETIAEEDVPEIFPSPADNGKGSWIITPIGRLAEDEDEYDDEEYEDWDADGEEEDALDENEEEEMEDDNALDKKEDGAEKAEDL